MPRADPLRAAPNRTMTPGCRSGVDPTTSPGIINENSAFRALAVKEMRRRGKNFAWAKNNACKSCRLAQLVTLPNTHVPVVVCRSAGIWTRGQLTALERPAAGGKPAHPAQRGTRLEATTDRAFLVSVGPPKVGTPKRLVYLAGRAEGIFSFPNDGSEPAEASRLRRVLATAQHLTARAVARRLSAGSSRIRASGRGWRVNADASRVSNARRAESHRLRSLHVCQARSEPRAWGMPL